MVKCLDEMYYIEDMREKDLPYVIAIRNHPDILPYLHTPIKYTLEQSKEWYLNSSPLWFCIKDVNSTDIVGYIRTSDIDYEAKSISIGCDIHSDHRRKGIATWGYNKIFDILKSRGWIVASLMVLKDNGVAIKMYESLGFEYRGEDDRSFYMEKKIGNGGDEKSVEVISCYLGYRRRGFFKPKHMVDMLKLLGDKVKEVNHGVPADTLLVYNKISDEEMSMIEDVENYNKCEEYLYSLDGQKTKNGYCYVVERKNAGISFGAYDYVFDKYKHKYKYWMFIEDDQIIIKNNVIKTCIEKLMNISLKNNQCGFVAIVGSSFYDGVPYAHGGCGCTSRDILNKVVDKNYSDVLKRNCLPNDSNFLTPMEYHEIVIEKKFTGLIYRDGYSIQSLDMDGIIVSWGSRLTLTTSVLSCTEALCVTTEFDLDVTYEMDRLNNKCKIHLAFDKKYEDKKLDMVCKKMSSGEVVNVKHFDIKKIPPDVGFWLTFVNTEEEMRDISVEISENGELLEKFYYPNSKKEYAMVKDRILILSAYTENIPWNNYGKNDYAPISLSINQKYAESNGYDFKYVGCKDNEVDNDYHPTWIKISTILDNIRLYDYVCWIDADAIFTTNKPLDFLFGRDIAITKEGPSYGFSQTLTMTSTGIMLIKNTLFSISVLNNLLIQSEKWDNGSFKKGKWHEQGLLDDMYVIPQVKQTYKFDSDYYKLINRSVEDISLYFSTINFLIFPAGFQSTDVENVNFVFHAKGDTPTKKTRIEKVISSGAKKISTIDNFLDISTIVFDTKQKTNRVNFNIKFDREGNFPKIFINLADDVDTMEVKIYYKDLGTGLTLHHTVSIFENKTTSFFTTVFSDIRYLDGVRVDIVDVFSGELLYSEDKKYREITRGKMYSDIDDISFNPFREIFITEDYKYFSQIDKGRIIQVEQGDICVDIGANLGFFSLYAIEQGAEKVYAVEPFVKTCDFLKKNVNGKNVEVVNKALGSKNGDRIFCINDKLSGGNHLDDISHDTKGHEMRKVIVSGMNINDFLHEYNIEYIDFLKIDCEGAEYEIFETLDENYLKNNIGKIVGEFHDSRNGEIYKLVDKLKAAGFECEFYSQMPWGEVPTEEILDIGLFAAWKKDKDIEDSDDEDEVKSKKVKNYLIDDITNNENKIDRKFLISFDSKSLGDTIAWMPYVEEYRKKHNCKVVLSTFWNHLFEKEYPEIEFVKPGTTVHNIHGTYNIGWYEPYDKRKNPQHYRTIPLQQTASDILGLEYKEIRPKMSTPE